MTAEEFSNEFDVALASYRRFKGYDDQDLPDTLEFDEYETDEIDGVDDSVNKAAFIYPQLTFNYHLPMLSSVLEKEKIDNQEKRESLLKDLDLKNHISNTQIWQFIAYSNKDSTIPQESVEDYIKAAKDKGVNMTRIFIPDQEHGFSDRKSVV